MDTQDHVASAMASFFSMGIINFFAYSISSDPKDPSLNVLEFKQGGLSLPKDKYIDPTQASVLEDFAEHIVNMLRLIGISRSEARKQAYDVVQIEKELANHTLPSSQLRDPELSYNKYTLEELEAAFEGFPFRTFLEASGASDEYPTYSYLVESPKNLLRISQMFSDFNAIAIQSYVRWHLLHGLANFLPTEFVNETFRFYNQGLYGQEVLAERWKRCVANMDSVLGELLGRYFVISTFSNDDLTSSKDMIRRIEDEFDRNLENVRWMDDKTRTLARQKLRMVNNKVGFPSAWTDYTNLVFNPDDFFGNFLTAKKADYLASWKELGRPVDRARWSMTPSTCNAYYDPSLNEMVFPAGIIQEPFYNSSFPMSMNFGSIGMIMGHELTHGFDDQGRKYDGTGNLTHWWSEDVARRFQDRAQCVIDKYSDFDMPEGHINGRLTVGENIADMGGVRMAFYAHRQWSQEHPQQIWSAVPFLNNDQLFFVAFAQTWCQLKRPDYQRMLLRSDPHAPGRYRVIGALQDLKEFSEVFQCSEGSYMNPDDSQRCGVW